jgi:hypothetical protein
MLKRMTPTDVRLCLLHGGFVPLPLIGKNPDVNGKGWQKRLETNEAEIELWARTWPYADNTGVLAISTPGLDIDILDAEAADAVEALAREHFEERGNILVRVGRPPKRLIPLRTDEAFKKMRRCLLAPNGQEHKIEILGDGQQWVAHGIHPDTGAFYGWHGGELTATQREDLPYVRGEDMEVFVDAAVQLLVEQFNYVLKSKTADDGELHAPGEPEAPIEKIAFALSVIPNDEDWDGYAHTGMAVWRASGGSDAGFAAFDGWARKSPKYDAKNTRTKWDEFFRSPPNSIGAGTIFWRATQASPHWWFDYQASLDPPPEPPRIDPQTPVFDPWERFIVPDFPLEILPLKIHNYIVEQSEVIGCDRAGFAMGTLAAFSGALNHQFAIKMMRHGNWYERPRLWVLLVADPAQRKTPIMTAVTRPLTHYEAHLRSKYDAEMRDYNIAVADGGKPPKPEPPPRYIVHDTTVEKLGELLVRSPKGLLVKADEISGWLGGMEKYNSGGRFDRAFWLQAYDGGPYSIDRIKRGELLSCGG